jgi:hypothetical protein
VSDTLRLLRVRCQLDETACLRALRAAERQRDEAHDVLTTTAQHLDDALRADHEARAQWCALAGTTVSPATLARHMGDRARARRNLARARIAHERALDQHERWCNDVRDAAKQLGAALARSHVVDDVASTRAAALQRTHDAREHDT